MTGYRKKLIEVALPLEAINIAQRSREIDTTWAPQHASGVVGMNYNMGMLRKPSEEP